MASRSSSPPTSTCTWASTGTSSAGITCGATQDGSVTAGVTYSNGSWSEVADKSFTFDLVAPEPYAAAEFKAFAGPQIGLKLYRIAGPYVNIEPFIRLKVDVVNPPLLGAVRRRWNSTWGSKFRSRRGRWTRDLPGQKVRRPYQLGHAAGLRREDKRSIASRQRRHGHGGDHQRLLLRELEGQLLRLLRDEESHGVPILVRQPDQVQGAGGVSGTVKVKVTPHLPCMGPDRDQDNLQRRGLHHDRAVGAAAPAPGTSRTRGPRRTSSV